MNVIIQINLEFEEDIEQMIQGSGFPLQNKNMLEHIVMIYLHVESRR